ncbi:FAD-dependent oxidoreductase [Spirosoma foliorum]|uniref:Flavin-dependent monooxygenase n=1 Tax=Spirosoma foliorum TaxID=2710596 RepID=A0A7G5H5P9_9BACT|nr:NAD(P)/FAD-dependent oxidoreductase [Spirosoma foliorum]QMW06441.1 FAD-dependent monooxygenase [Spirosoma foliorum]
MLITNKQIAIVGGGPGGLTLARLLQQRGANVNVYERDVNKDVRVQGATLDLHDDSGLLALQEAGLTDAFNANFRPGADKTRIVDKHATILYDDDTKENHETSRPEIDRGPLRKILLESLQPDTVVWDSYLLSLLPVGDGWKLDFQNGTSALADIVIAADGANSKIRPLITPIKPFYSGITVVEGKVYDSATTAPGIHTLLNGGKIFAISDEKTLIVSSKGDGSLVFYTGSKTDENWAHTSGIDFNDNAQVLAWFQREFAGWDSSWLELFEKADAPFIPRPQYCMPLDQHWNTLPNLTMLGDAAHLMPPYAGEGVNMAMLDALELSKCLTSSEFPDVQTAIAKYEKQMLVRFAEIGGITLEQTASLHSQNGLANMLSMFDK